MRSSAPLSIQCAPSRVSESSARRELGMRLDQARPVQLLASLDNFFEGGSMRSWGLLILPVESGRPDVRFDCVRDSVSERECEMRGDGPVI